MAMSNAANTLKSWLAAATVGAVGLTALACTPGGGSDSANPPAGIATAADVGASLYPAAPMPALPAATPVGEPIVLPNAVVQYDMRTMIPAAVDGIIELIATPLKDGEKFDPNDTDIVYHPRDAKREQPYRKLRVNDLVSKGQVLARLDDQLIYMDKLKALEAIPTIKDSVQASSDAAKFQKELLESMQKTGVSSKMEVLQQQSLYARYVENQMNSMKELIKTQGEYRSADTQHKRYWIMSEQNGRVVRILKSAQDFAKAGETLIELQSTERVKVEAKIDAGYTSQVRKGMRVYVEPTRPLGADSLSNAVHRQEVTAVAVTAHPGRPMIVSGGLDSSVLLWDVTASKQTTALATPPNVGVRSLAATGPKSKAHLVAAGGDDGKVRVWDISNPDKPGKEPVVTFEEAHGGAVAAVAFSPDGRFLATASGRDVFVWSVGDRKRLYALPPEQHRDAVTALRFTPQATLVTDSRDKAIRDWKLGETGAALIATVDHRGGAVEVLGVSSDGSRVLFDKDATRLDVVSLADQRSVGTVQNPGGGARFALFAYFSPDDKLILTAGADNEQRGELTVWETPAPGSRAAERRRLVTPKNSAVTCAAFSPDAAHPFVVAGTADGGVHFWTGVTAAGSQRLVGEVVSVVPVDAKTSQVSVELTNPAGGADGEGLQDRSAATIIIPPGGVDPPVKPNARAPQAAPAPAVVPAAAAVPAKSAGGAVVPAGGVIPLVNVPPVSLPPIHTRPGSEPKK
jgi:WD40 repeat protein